MPDSLIIADTIELMGGGVASTIADCAGAVFRLAPGFDLNSPQPTSDYVASLVTDGEVPVGERSSNRTITLPIVIYLPQTSPATTSTDAMRTTLIAAREVLSRAVSKQRWLLRWQREGSSLPTIFECYRATSMKPTYATWLEKQGAVQIELTFPAAPYGRSDTATIANFTSPLAGLNAPASPLVIDSFSSVSGTQWAASTLAPAGVGSASALWDPSIAPADNPAGTGLAATYTKTGLSLNLAAGYNFACAATGTTTTYVAASTNVVNASVGDQFQIFTGGSPAQAQIFTVQSISPVSGGNQTVTFTPAAASAPGTSQNIVQTGPPQLPAVTVWAGFGSSNYYRNWGLKGGPVHFLLTLTDTNGVTVASSRIDPLVYGSASSTNPKWVRIRIPLTYKPGFDYENVTAYTLTVTNRGSALVFTQLYLAALTAVPTTTQVITPVRGVVYDLAGMVGSARCAPSFQFQQAGTFVTSTATFTLPGTSMWTAPFSIISLTNVFVIGGGGAGPRGWADGGGGGSGGSSGFSTSAVAVTPGKAYTLVVGSGGVPGGAAPIASSFTGDAVTISAPGGKNATASSSTGATANAAGTPGGFAGGPGGNGVASSTGGGGGGGASGGSAAAGTTGSAASGSTGGAQVAGVTGGGPGGRGGTFGSGNGVQPTSGYGGASGGSPGGASGYFYPGFNGVVELTYTTPPLFKSLLVHRPGTFTDPQFNPLLPIPPGDPINGSVAYQMPQLTAGLNARFGNGAGPGTFSVVVAASAWNSPTVSRTITVTVTLWEQQGGNSYPQTVAWSFIPNNLPLSSPFVVLGNLTIPAGTDLPPDNIAAFYTVSVNDTNTSDTLDDVLFLDTTGSTVMLYAPNSYTSMYVDEPVGTRDIGQILASPTDRSAAISVLSGAQAISGGPLTIDPYGNQSLLAYCIEGAPNMQMTYYPRWLFDRLS